MWTKLSYSYIDLHSPMFCIPFSHQNISQKLITFTLMIHTSPVQPRIQNPLLVCHLTNSPFSFSSQDAVTQGVTWIVEFTKLNSNLSPCTKVSRNGTYFYNIVWEMSIESVLSNHLSPRWALNVQPLNRNTRIRKQLEETTTNLHPRNYWRLHWQ